MRPRMAAGVLPLLPLRSSPPASVAGALPQPWTQPAPPRLHALLLLLPLLEGPALPLVTLSSLPGEAPQSRPATPCVRLTGPLLLMQLLLVSRRTGGGSDRGAPVQGCSSRAPQSLPPPKLCSTRGAGPEAAATPLAPAAAAAIIAPAAAAESRTWKPWGPLIVSVLSPNWLLLQHITAWE